MASVSGSMWSTQIYVDRWQGGDEAAVGDLCLRFSPLICYRISHSKSWIRLRSGNCVEDVEQEVWARVLKSGPTAFTSVGKGSFIAWVGNLADSTMVDLVRRAEAQKRGGGKGPDVLDTLAEHGARRFPGNAASLSPSGQARISEFQSIAEQVLNDREMKAWTWVALEGFTSEEAALGLDCSAAAVRSLLVRSRGKLQQAIAASKSQG